MAPIIMNGSSPARLNQRGHLLLVVIVLITLLTLVLSMAIQPIRTTKQRMLEAELVYRGEHIAAGIRAFYLQKGRFPFELDELVDHEPRFVRRIYTDPMTKDGEWELVYLTPGQEEGVRALGVLAEYLGGDVAGEEQTSETEKDGPGLSGGADSVFSIKTRQITGIRSMSDTEGLKVRDDSRIYADWLFSAVPQKRIEIKDLIKQIDQFIDRR